MWCGHENSDAKERTQDLITYFEGTCEFCIGNMGMASYRKEVSDMMQQEKSLDDETIMLLYYVGSVIDYRVENFSSALPKWQKAETLARQMGNEVYLAKIYSYVAVYYYVKKDMKKSREYFDEAVKLFLKHKMYSELALHYINILWYKRYEKDKTEVLEYLGKALEYVRISDAKTDAKVYLHIGYIYKTIFNDFITGFKHLKVARELCFRNGNFEMECMAFHVLADGYMQLGNYESAVKIYRDIADMKQYPLLTVNLKCMMLSNLIPAYMHLKNYGRAKKALEKMEGFVPLSQVNIREQFAGTAKWLRAQIYIAGGERLSEALSLLRECEALSEKYTTGFFVEEFDFRLAGTFGDLYMAEENHVMALECYQKQYDLSQKYGALERMQAAGNLSDVYAREENFEEALRYRKIKMENVEKIERERLLSQYDRLYQEFFKGVQEEQIQLLTEEQKDLELHAFVDQLTGLPDRHCFDGYIKTFRQQDGESPLLAIIFADVDYFKKYNDGFGHAKGDVCLSELGALFAEFVKDKRAKAFRYGGEEFIFILQGYEKEDVLSIAIDLAEEVRNLGIEHPWSDVAETVTVSVGCSVISDEVTDISELIRQADEALYYVKDNGRNGAWMF